MVIYKSLYNTDIEKIHKTFIEAFSNYEVKLDLPISKFQQMIKRRGYVSTDSVGAFKNDDLIGFILTGIRDYNGKLTAYDVATGVIEKYRGNSLTNNMFRSIKNLLKEKGIEKYLLEVIQSNTPAVKLYKKQGFEISRDFDCFYLEKNNYVDNKQTCVTKHIFNIDENDWIRFEKFWDFTPSWQNSIYSINADKDTFTYYIVSIDDNIVGYGIIDNITGDIPQIAVDKNYRRLGIGRSIFKDLIYSTKSNKISVLNVGSTCESMKKFLLKLGFRWNISQYEMILNLYK